MATQREREHDAHNAWRRSMGMPVSRLEEVRGEVRGAEPAEPEPPPSPPPAPAPQPEPVPAAAEMERTYRGEAAYPEMFPAPLPWQCYYCSTRGLQLRDFVDHLGEEHRGIRVPCPYCGDRYEAGGRGLAVHARGCASNPERVARTRRTAAQMAQARAESTGAREQAAVQTAEQQQQLAVNQEPAMPTPEPTPEPTPTPEPAEAPASPPPPEPIHVYTTLHVITDAADLTRVLIAGTETDVIPVELLPRLMDWLQETQALRQAMVAAMNGKAVT